jgi:hypothetical protein
MLRPPDPLDCGKSSLRRSAAARRFALETSTATSLSAVSAGSASMPVSVDISAMYLYRTGRAAQSKCGTAGGLVT